MQLGVDFDGTVIRYAVCAASDGGDRHVIVTTEKPEQAKYELKIIINRAKKRKHATETKFWIMKQTFKYEKIYKVDLEEEEENNEE